MRKKNSCLALLDISKACDSVWRVELWQYDEASGVEEKLMRECEGLIQGGD